jgi:peptidoglycan/xylan/chitin deacetylase (PgdA/CDA1 family)
VRRRYLITVVAAVAATGLVSGRPARAAGAPVARFVYQIPGSGYGPNDKVAAITFDDGPWSPSTAQIESILTRQQAPATFFEIGRQANAAPAVTHRLATLGFGIGDHTWDHVDLSQLPPSGYPSEVGRTISLLTSLSGRPVTCTRPPGGRYDATALDQLGQRGQTLVLYSADTRDYARPGVDTIVSRALTGLTNGSIILMHDGGGDRSQTVAALPRIIAGIRAQGFRLVPICGGHSPGPVVHDVPAFGVAAAAVLASPVPSNLALLGAAATPSGQGYWTVASDGGVFTFGDAGFYGSTGGLALNQPVVGMAPTPDGRGYWLVASDGGIFSFGDAGFSGSTGGLALNQPVVGMAATPTGKGYWLVASDGGIFSFGDAGFFGSPAGQDLHAWFVAVAPAAGGAGYWVVGQQPA